MRPFTLRPLPLGVLIVVGGTLAALPFRRYQPTGHLASSSGQADGPTASSLTASRIQAWSPASPLGPQPPAPDADRSGRSWEPPQPQRLMHMPLTYEDLAVPIDQSPGSAGRPATAVGHRENRARTASGDEAVAAIPNLRPQAALPPETDLQPLKLSAAPPADLLAEAGPNGDGSILVQTPSREQKSSSRAPSQRAVPPEEASRAETADDPPASSPTKEPASSLSKKPASSPSKGSSPAPGGSLASSQLPESKQRPLVQEPAPQRERHWIRQPR